MASPADTSPRPVQPGEALPEPALGQSGIAGAQLNNVVPVVGAAAGTAAKLPAVAFVVPKLILAPVGGVEDLVKALIVYHVLMRARVERWIVAQTKERLPLQDILDVIGEESGRQKEFERRQIDRVRRDGARIMQLPESERPVELGKVAQRERVYSRYRAEAMAVRAFSAIDRVVLRKESPNGAFWKLGDVVSGHTADCLFMARYGFWPWEALDLLHPPTHVGCRCSLHSWDEAVRNGWVKAGQVMSLPVAMRRVAQARAMLHESDLDGIWARAVAAGVEEQLSIALNGLAGIG